MTWLAVAAVAVGLGAALLALDHDGVRDRVAAKLDGIGPRHATVATIAALAVALAVRVAWMRQGLPYAWSGAEERLVDGWSGAPLDGLASATGAFTAARALAVALSLCQVGAAGLLADRLAGRWAAAATVLALAAVWPVVAGSVLATPTTAAVASTLAATLALHRYVRADRRWLWIGAALLVVAAVLDWRALAVGAALPVLPLIREDPPEDHGLDALWAIAPPALLWALLGVGAFGATFTAVAAGVLVARVAGLGDGTWKPVGAALVAIATVAAGAGGLADAAVAWRGATVDSRALLATVMRPNPDSALGVVDELRLHPDHLAALGPVATGPARELLCDGTLDRVVTPRSFASERRPERAVALDALLPGGPEGRPVNLDRAPVSPEVAVVHTFPLPAGCLASIDTDDLFTDPAAPAATARGDALRFEAAPWIRGPQIRLPAGGYSARLHLRTDTPGRLRVVAVARGGAAGAIDVDTTAAGVDVELPFTLGRTSGVGLEIGPVDDAPLPPVEVRALRLSRAR